MRKIKILISLLILILFIGFQQTIATPEGIKDFEKDIQHIIKKVSPNVVRVESEDGARRIATGVVFDKEGYLITTALIASKEKELKVKTINGKEFTAKLIGTDFETKLMEKLAIYKKRRERKIKYFKICLAAAVVIIFVYLGLNFLFFKGNENEISSELYQEEKVLPVIEVINYSGELSKLSNGKKTIYILEQISDREGIYF